MSGQHQRGAEGESHADYFHRCHRSIRHICRLLEYYLPRLFGTGLGCLYAVQVKLLIDMYRVGSQGC